MPGQSGLEAAEEVAERWDGVRPFPQVVFVTAYDDYAVDAFDQAAADYVLKPFNDARLGKTIERLRQRLARPEPAGGMAHLMEQLRALVPAAPAQEHLSTIRAASGNQVRMIPVTAVAYFQAVDKYVNVVTQEGESLIRLSLRDLLPQLDPARFSQVHRGTIVNMDCVASAIRDESGKVMLTLRNRPEKLRVSLVYAHLFRPM
jgi:DNA-binding LytR/AlgR family response regulator